MTKFQALFVLWLRHEKFCDCSWRALAGNYYARYEKCSMWKYDGYDGNQLDGMQLDIDASKILGINTDCYDCDLTKVNANLKRHTDE